jgi:hypothetical protein
MSPQILLAPARSLAHDRAGRDRLFRLAGAEPPTPATAAAPVGPVGPELRTLLDAPSPNPVFVVDRRFHHPVDGELDLTYVRLAAEDGPGRSVVAHFPEPGSPAQERLHRRVGPKPPGA